MEKKPESYRCRPGIFKPTYRYVLGEDALLRYRGDQGSAMPFRDIRTITVFKERRWGSSRSYWAARLKSATTYFDLTAAHRGGLRRTEDRTETYIPFVKEIERRAFAANPKLAFVRDEYRESLPSRLVGRLAVTAIRIMGLLPRRSAASIGGAIARSIGPLSRAHSYSREQMQAAFPRLGRPEIDLMLRGMWNHLGRTFAEYAHIRQLMTFSCDASNAGPVTMDAETAACIRRLAQSKAGALLFSAHIGNWEVPAMAAQAEGLEIALLFRAQASRAITDFLVRARLRFAGSVINADRAAPVKIVRALQNGQLVGLLIDQHYAGGIDVEFFGRPCKVNPALAALARRGWPVYSARAIRQFNGDHRLEVRGPLRFPVDAADKIDVQKGTQMIFQIVESWIKEHPEQWMWMHRLIR